MARWRLTTAHYLKVQGTEWEYQETSQMTGKIQRHRFPVPMMLDPKDASDWNYRQDEMIVVCWEDKGLPKDYVFEGNPTADMEPLDDEAQAVTDSLKQSWVHPIESLAATGGLGGALLADFEKQLTAALRNATAAAVAPVQAVSMNGVDPGAFAKLQQQVQELMAINAALQAEKLETPPAEAQTERRV